MTGDGARAAAWAVVAAGAAVFGLTLHGGPAQAALGPGVLPWLWAPPALASGASLAALRGHASTSAALGIASRAALWLLGARWLTDPAPNGPDMIAGWAGDVLGRLRSAVLALGGLLLAGAVVAAFMEPAPAPDGPRRARVAEGGPVGPATAGILRLGLRLALWAATLLLRLGVLAAAWTAAGVDGVRQTASGGGTGPAVRATAGMFAAVGGGSSLLAGWLGRATSGWGRRTGLGVWVAPTALARDAEGEVVEDADWPARAGEGDEEAALRELACGLVAAYDVALSAPGRAAAQDPRAPAPRLTPYRIEVARAWARPEYLAAVVRVAPPYAAAAAARLGPDALVPALDAATSLTAADLRRLRLSDPRVAADPLREGATGLFVALDREPARDAARDLPRDPATAALARALDEAGLAATFRVEGRDEGFDADTVECRASFRTSAEFRELESAWRGLQPAVALFARNPGVRLDVRLDPYSFVATFPRAAPEFPSGEAVDLERVLARWGPQLRRHALRFVLGLDHRGEPLFVELGSETPHLLVAGGTGSGKSRAVFSALAQLLALTPPDRLGVWLLDSVKRELTGLFGDAPHVERSAVAEDAAGVVGTLAAFAAAMDARYRELGGREFDPARGRSHLLVVEEWADLRDLLDRSELDEVVRLVNRVGQVGRGAGFHLVLVTQKASAEVIPPRLKSNFKGRVAGFFSQASDYGILFDEHRRLLPNAKGRLAVSLGDGGVRVVQAVYGDNAAVRRVVGRLAPAGAAPPALDALIGEQNREPRRPTAREVELLAPATLARVLCRWQAEEPAPIVVSVRSVADHLRSKGYTPGRTERLAAALAELEALGVLERASDSRNAPRRIRATWSEAAARLGLPGAT